MPNDPPFYNATHQTRSAEPSPWENQLGDAIEAAFAQGIHALPALVDEINRHGLTDPDGQAWTPSRFEAEMARLGA